MSEKSLVGHVDEKLEGSHSEDGTGVYLQDRGAESLSRVHPTALEVCASVYMYVHRGCLSLRVGSRVPPALSSLCLCYLCGVVCVSLVFAGGWYHMGMDEVMIGAILQALCACAGTEAHGKQLRLQRVCIGLAAYFASEQMGADSLVGSGIDQVMLQVLTNFPGEGTTTQLCCVIINSIAMTSGDMYEGIKTKELIAALKAVCSSRLRDPRSRSLDVLETRMKDQRLDAVQRQLGGRVFAQQVHLTARPCQRCMCICVCLDRSAVVYVCMSVFVTVRRVCACVLCVLRDICIFIRVWGRPGTFL